MITNKEIIPATVVKRSRPENYNEKDAHLFYEDDFEITTRAVQVVLVKEIRLSNLLVFKGLKVVSEICRHIPLPFSQKVKNMIKLVTYPKRDVNIALSSVHQWGTNYFHWLTEVLPSILILTDLYKDVPLLVPAHYRKYKFITESLSLIGVTPNYYKPTEILKINEFIALSLPKVCQFNPPFLYRFTSRLEQIAGKPKEIGRRVYISRSKALRRIIVNEKQLLEVLISQGFVICSMEELSFMEQVKIMNETSVVISCHGGGLANLMFMPQNGVVFELKANNNDYNCFFSLARTFNHKYYYQLCKPDSINHRSANINVDIERFKENLETILRITN